MCTRTTAQDRSFQALEGRVKKAAENYKETFLCIDCGGGTNHLLSVVDGREREREERAIQTP